MSDLNNLSITGRLTKDAVKRIFPESGKPYCTFDIANNTGFGNYAVTNFFKCILADSRAETMSQYLTKGKLIAVSGILEKNEWIGNEGKPNKDWQLKVGSIALLGEKRQEPDR